MLLVVVWLLFKAGVFFSFFFLQTSKVHASEMVMIAINAVSSKRSLSVLLSAVETTYITRIALALYRLVTVVRNYLHTYVHAASTSCTCTTISSIKN